MTAFSTSKPLCRPPNSRTFHHVCNIEIMHLPFFLCSWFTHGWDGWKHTSIYKRFGSESRDSRSFGAKFGNIVLRLYKSSTILRWTDERIISGHVDHGNNDTCSRIGLLSTPLATSSSSTSTSTSRRRWFKTNSFIDLSFWIPIFVL